MNSRLRRYFPRVPLAVPFWSGETYRNILRCIVSREIIAGPDRVELKRQLLAFFGVPDIVLCGSGSLALELALRVCGLRAGDEVIIPSFCCSTVVAPILAVGAIPVLADVGSELNLTVETVDAARTTRTRAIIVPHLFGNPADIGAIAELGNANNIVVIDDAAQALGATIDDRPAGSCGDMGVVSFGAEKVCFGIGGGVLVAHSGGVLDAARHIVLGYPGIGSTLARLASTVVLRRCRGWTLPLQRLLWRGHERSPDAPAAGYRQENLANLSAAVACSLMDSLVENLRARRARVEAYQRLLEDHAGVELIRHRSGSACLTQAIRVLPKRRDDDSAAGIIRALGQAGYEVQGSYLPIHLLGQFSACVWDRLPHTEKVWADLVELPCEPTVSMGDVERIAIIIKSCIGS